MPSSPDISALRAVEMNPSLQMGFATSQWNCSLFALKGRCMHCIWHMHADHLVLHLWLFTDAVAGPKTRDSGEALADFTRSEARAAHDRPETHVVTHCILNI